MPPKPEFQALIDVAADLRLIIRGYAAEIERERRIPATLVMQLRRAGLYRFLYPRELGGTEADLDTYHRVLELASEGDGAVGWNVATSSGSGLPALSLPEDGLQEIFGNGPDVTFSGTIGQSATARAIAVEGGYLVSGHWRYGSGCNEADWFHGLCRVFENGEPRHIANGAPEIRHVYLRPADCTIHDTWDVMGLRGTGSHDWSAAGVFVPERLTQRAGASARAWTGTMYALPGEARATFTSVATGIARSAIDALVELAAGKTPTRSPGLLRETPMVQEWVGRAEALLGAAQAYRAAVSREIWDAVASGIGATRDQRVHCRLAGAVAVENALQATQLMYRAAGMNSVGQGDRIGRCWRDLQVAAQHILVSADNFAMAGRSALGLEPGGRSLLG